ncbi:MAG: hypothetical protein FGM51_00375 [Polynucleobacter sp.]|jgi:hypothetical protein|nr:hypothetical protein [Polynucleobacter sp.]
MEFMNRGLVVENLKKQSQIIQDMNKTFSDLKKAKVINAQQIAEYQSLSTRKPKRLRQNLEKVKTS